MRQELRISKPSVGALCLTAGALALTLVTAACASDAKRSKLPPPVYEQPTLPPWQAPEAEDPEGSLDGGGEWVDGPPPGTTTPGEPAMKPTDGAPAGAAGAPAREN